MNKHPLHPPFTDATIGAYTVAAVLAVLGFAGVSESRLAIGWWLALLVALCLTVPTALTGLLDWLKITRWTPLWRVATSHMLAMVSGAGVFLAALLTGHADYSAGRIGDLSLGLTLGGFVLLTLGGWLGGTIVFVYGMRVLNRSEEPALDAAAPVETAEDRRRAA